MNIDSSAADVDIVAHGSVRQYTIENMSEDKEGEESMDYEELYASLIQTEKTLNDNIKLGVRLGKTIGKDTESGDLKDLQKTLDQYAEVIEKQKAEIECLRSEINAEKAENKRLRSLIRKASSTLADATMDKD